MSVLPRSPRPMRRFCGILPLHGAAHKNRKAFIVFLPTNDTINLLIPYAVLMHDLDCHSL